MVFRSRIDRYFLVFISVVALLIGLVTLLPIFLDKDASVGVISVMVALFVVLEGFIVWTVFFIKYVFYEDYLFVKGGPFRSRISYQNITKVSPTTSIFNGYRILSSRDGLEIFYKSGILGSVVISPENVDEFMNELKKRCPHIRVRE